MAHMQVREIYAQLQECMNILREPEILAYFGGSRRKSVWTVIEELYREEFRVSPNIGAYRSLAVDGNRVFKFIAEFDEASVKQEYFFELLQAGESYILNMSLLGDTQERSGEEFEEEFEDNFAEDSFEDDF